MLQILANRAYLVAQIDDHEGGKFVSRAIVTAEGPEHAVHKVRDFLTKKGDLTPEGSEMQAIELGDVPDTCDLDQPLLLKNGEEFEW